MRTPRIRCGPSAPTRQKQRVLLNAGGLGREDQINYTSRAVVQVCERVQPRLAVSRYVDACLKAMATEPGFERIEGASSAAGNEFVR